MSKKKKIDVFSDKEIMEAVKSSINFLLLEELGVPDNVISEANIGVKKILDVFDPSKFEWKYENVRTQDYLFSFSVPFIVIDINNPFENEPFNNVKALKMKIYLLKNMDELNVIGDSLGIGGDFNIVTNEISMTLVSVDFKLSEWHLREHLVHELNHFFQNYKMEGNNKLSHAYQIAAGLISGKIKARDKIQYDAARLIYFFNKREIDSKLSEFYVELLGNNELGREIQSLDELNYCKSFKSIDKGKRLFMEMSNINYNQKLLSEYLIKFFRISPKVFFKRINESIRYTNNKLRRIIQKHFNDLKHRSDFTSNNNGQELS